MKDIISALKKANEPQGIKKTISKFHTSSKFSHNWTTTGTHLISNLPSKPQIQQDKVKIAAFDLDGTLINTKTGSSFARGSSDWKVWCHVSQESTVIPKLKQLIVDGYTIVIFTNQGGVSLGQANSKSYTNFTERVTQFVEFVQKDIPRFSPIVFASPKRPAGKKIRTSSDELHILMRKPQIGMWSQLKKYLDKEVDEDASFYVGDAAGRQGDFLDSDKKFAENINIKFKTPEEFF